MKLNELKVGDKVKYKKEEGICGINHSNIYECEGNILEIHNEYGGFFQITNNNYYNKQISVKFKDIISKLEPYEHCDITTRYKEIPIEKEENKTSIQELQEGLQRLVEIARKAEYSLEDFINSNWKCSNSPPKSFKFDFKIQSSECNYNQQNKRMSAKMMGFGTFENDRIEMDLVLPYHYSLGDLTLDKTYTVEIKEKKKD